MDLTTSITSDSIALTTTHQGDTMNNQAAAELDRFASEASTILDSQRAKDMMEFAREFNNSVKAATAVAAQLLKGVDPSTITESTDELAVTYGIELTDQGVAVVKDVSVKAHFARDRFTLFYEPVVSVSRQAATELGVDLLRALAVQ